MGNSVSCRVFFASERDYLIKSEIFYRSLRDSKNFYYFDEKFAKPLEFFPNAHKISDLPIEISSDDGILISDLKDLTKISYLKSFYYYNLGRFCTVGPLAGIKVLIPRTEKEQEQEIGRFGAVGIEVPLLKINYILDESLKTLDFSEYDWIIFTSTHGVRGFFFNLQHFKIDPRKLSFIKFAVVGEKTALTLKEFGFTADFTSSKFTAKDLALELINSKLIKKKVLVAQGNLGRLELLEIFENNNILTQKLLVYENTPNTEIKPFLNGLLKAELIDVLFFTSPSTFNNFYEFLEDETLALKLPHFAIGPTTYEAFTMKNIKNKYFAAKHTLDGLWHTLKTYIQGE
ncbi:uroporphyrinogen-III synthase [Carboxydothermus pertinax]|uniref:Uroporphyrinogen-III synthase n=1 Tax=Carboxydothermus pertinax TaxID=870242 RepID=A0A1L8CUC6_9THEO|nr:uroporphyrinogen-III synthase [Carboxydothermus pertinax]GAV22474.1 uroporphyrinogen III methyltransferase [Carboxydothermus pertinax]